MIETRFEDPRRDNLSGDMVAVFAYWSELKGQRFAPSWREFDWMRIPARIVPWCSVVDVSIEPLDFRYRFFGTARTSLVGQDYTNHSVREFAMGEIADKAFREYKTVYETKRPIAVLNTGYLGDDEGPVHYHFLRLPMSDDGVDVHNILAVSVYCDQQLRFLYHYYGTDK